MTPELRQIVIDCEKYIETKLGGRLFDQLPQITDRDGKRVVLSEEERLEVMECLRWRANKEPQDPTTDQELQWLMVEDHKDNDMGRKLRQEWPDEPIDDFLERWDRLVEFRVYEDQRNAETYKRLGPAAEMLLHLRKNPKATRRQIQTALNISQPTFSRWSKLFSRPGGKSHPPGADLGGFTGPSGSDRVMNGYSYSFGSRISQPSDFVKR